MANEYEIKEVGYLGSIWQGDFNTPVQVGRTVEITNIPTTINGNTVQSMFFGVGTGIDIDKLTNQLPEKNSYYKIDFLPQSEIENLRTNLKLDPSFSSINRVLYRFFTKYGESPSASKVPIEFNWSFDSTDKNKPVYLYDIPEAIVFAKYVFLVGSNEILDQVIEYFKNIKSVETIFDTQVYAVPPTTTQTTSVNTNPPPPIVNTPVFSTPPVDMDLLSDNEATKQFNVVKSQYEVTSLEDFNVKLRAVESESRDVMMFINEKMGTLPFTDMKELAIRVKLLMMIRNYLFEQLAQLNNINTPIKSPENYGLNTDGDIVILSNEQLPIKTLSPNINQQESIDEFDELIDEIVDDLTVDDNSVYVFKRISRVTDYNPPVVRHKTFGMFTCEGEKLNTFYTQSLTSSQSPYFISVLNAPENSPTSYHQFDITYAHISGSGSSYIVNGSDNLPAKTMYRKYMLECFGDTNGKFRFKNNVNGDYFYAIHFDRDVFKDGIDVGNIELRICPLTSSTNQLINTGSNFRVNQSSSVIYSLIDDSRDSKQAITNAGAVNDYYYLVSGSIRDGIYSEPNDNAWGVVFWKQGLIILDGVVLDQSCSFNTVTASIDGDNTRKLFVSISGSSSPNLSRQVSASLFARSVETTLTETYFCRVEPEEFNYSSNYTYVSGSNNFFKYDYFIDSPHSYITTIGLYNKEKELVAIGKTKHPVRKNDGKPLVFQVRVRVN